MKQQAGGQNDSDDKKVQEAVDDPCEEIKQERDEWKAKYLRALADYQNLERRVKEERKEITYRTEEVVIHKLLPIVDLFDEVLKHEKYASDLGLKAIHKQLHDLIQVYGVGRIIVLGDMFNPHTMECIGVKEVESDKENDKVLEEVAKGYTFRNKLLRVAKVIVGKSSSSEAEGDKKGA